MERSYFLFINNKFYQHCNSPKEALTVRTDCQRDCPQFKWTVVVVRMTDNLDGTFTPNAGVLEETTGIVSAGAHLRSPGSV